VSVPGWFAGGSRVAHRAEIRLWRSELLNLRTAPFNVGTDAVFVAYYASAELGCFLELGWPLPVNVVDLFVEHRCETNGVPTTCGDGLVGALALRGLIGVEGWLAPILPVSCVSRARSDRMRASQLQILGGRGPATEAPGASATFGVETARRAVTERSRST
jgi:hypothetical protein